MKSNLLLRLIIVINILLIIPACHAQSPPESIINDVLEDLIINNEVNNGVDNTTNNGEYDVNWENELEELAIRLKEPIDLNNTSREQLEQIPFLSDIQIENVLAYVYIHGEMKTLFELQLVKYMDKETINRLLPFVCIKAINKEDTFRWKSMLTNAAKYGKNEVLTRVDIPLYTRKGYKQTYLGPSVYNSIKYGFRYSDKLFAGIVAEKDAGEPLFAQHNRLGYDYYSVYILLKNWGWLKALAVGNYRMSFGQGLVINTDYVLGKSVYATSFNNRSTGIKKHSSTDEYNYFQGTAATVALTKQWTATGFYSNRRLDGTIENNEITSIYKTGLHRSSKEAEKRHTLNLQLTGGNVSYQHNRIRVGITGIYYFFDRLYEPLLTGYAKYNIHGNKFYNVGVDFAYRYRRFSIQGEVAKGKQGAATVNRLQYSPIETMQLMFIQRYYSYDYWGMFARSFGEGSGVQNEQGYYFAIESSPIKYWRFFTSFDYFSFPWKKYRISKQGSQGVDLLLQTTYSPKENLSMDFRYRYKQKERDLPADIQKNTTLTTYHHQLRFRMNYSPIQLLTTRTTIDYNHFHSQGRKAVSGYQITEMISTQLPWIKLNIDIQGTFFSTDDYDSRVYVSEKGLLYTFYTPSFQGKGYRCNIRLRYEPNEYIMFITKIGETIYTDRNEIGTGNDLIYGNKKADVQMQLRIKF